MDGDRNNVDAVLEMTRNDDLRKEEEADDEDEEDEDEEEEEGDEEDDGEDEGFLPATSNGASSSAFPLASPRRSAQLSNTTSSSDRFWKRGRRLPICQG